MYYTGSNPTLEQLTGLMNYLEEAELEPEDITQNVIMSKIRQNKIKEMLLLYLRVFENIININFELLFLNLPYFFLF